MSKENTRSNMLKSLNLMLIFHLLKVKCQSFLFENTSKEIENAKIVNAMSSLNSQYVTEKVYVFIIISLFFNL
jgi:hypothetical protein